MADSNNAPVDERSALIARCEELEAERDVLEAALREIDFIDPRAADLSWAKVIARAALAGVTDTRGE